MRGFSYDQFLDAFASRAPTPAGGALAFVTLAGCAALTAKLARIAKGDADALTRWSELFLEHAKADSESYSPGNPEVFAAELHRAENACDFLGFLRAPPFALTDRTRPDFAAAQALAEAAGGAIAGNLQANLALLGGGVEDFSERVTAILRRVS